MHIYNQNLLHHGSPLGDFSVRKQMCHDLNIL